MAMAMSSSEVNGSMGKIVACPTAGSCGILPAVILTTGELLNKTDDELITGLFAASAIGMIIGMNATFSGAEGGCHRDTFRLPEGVVLHRADKIDGNLRNLKGSGVRDES